MRTLWSAATVCGACALGMGAAQAAEDFHIRYNMTGSLGSEMFSRVEEMGVWTGAIALTHVDIRRLTGADGERLTAPVPGGIVPLPAPTPSALYPTYGSSRALVYAEGTQVQWNLGLRYIPTQTYGGGRVLLGINLPYATKKQNFAGSGSAPALNWNPAVPAQTRAVVQARFGASYQAGLDAEAEAQSGKVSGLGDLELSAVWRGPEERDWRVTAGAALVLPTGRYSASAGPDIGFGDFYTLRPVVEAVRFWANRKVALAGRLTLGLNTTNRDNDWRSGNWIAFEPSLGYRTEYGAFGIQALRAQQYQSDHGNPRWGDSRYRMTMAGLFYAARFDSGLAITLNYMDALSSREAKHGRYAQVRVAYTF